MSGWALQDRQEILAIVADLATTLAMIVAGVWTYLLFVKNRERYPRATIEQVASPLKLDDQSTLVRVQIRVSNIGKGLLPIEDLDCRLQQVVPVVGAVKARVHANGSPVISAGSDVDWPKPPNREERQQPRSPRQEPAPSTQVPRRPPPELVTPPPTA